MDPVQAIAEQSAVASPDQGVNGDGNDSHAKREGSLFSNGMNGSDVRRKTSRGTRGRLSQSLKIKPPQSLKGAEVQFKSTNGLNADLHRSLEGSRGPVTTTDLEVQSQHSDRSDRSSHSSTVWRTKTKRLFTSKYVPTTTPEDETPALPESEVERIVQRLEDRNANRVHVPSEVKARFLKMCLNVCRLRDMGSSIDCGCGEIKVSSDSPCILRSDVINMRNRVRLEVEQRSRSRQISDAVKSYFGFRCHSKVLLNVLNRAVDLIDESGHAKARERRRSTLSAGPSIVSKRGNHLDINESAPACPLRSQALDDLDEQEWFYYKDFSFYSLKVESSYPWMRSPLLYSVLLTISFYIMSPILWCSILKDENICPASHDGMHNDWTSALYFSAVTAATVGYGDITVLVGENEYVENWRVLIAILFMIVSLVVSVVGFQAGLDSHFNPFRRKIDLFVKRAYDIVHEGDTMDKHDHVLTRMKWAKISELAEITLIFFILNLIGVFALQIFVAADSGMDSISWMESFYWAVQTTTTVGYGDVQTPDSFRWFLLIYLAISTYFVGNALGKLRDLGKRLDSMQRLYLWQQQEASFEMLSDFSGRKDYATNGEGKIVDVNPEIDQFEFTVASLVLLGKITAEDVKPIIKRFKELTSTNKITAADVAGPEKKKANKEVNVESGSQQLDDGPDEEMQQSKPTSSNNAVSVGKKIALAFKEEVLSSSVDYTGGESTKDAAAEAVDYTKFTLPKNTYAIAIDDSKIQRKLLSRYFDFAGIPQDNCTIIGDGKDEIMGFEDFVLQFMEKHLNDFVLLIVDENLDVAGDDATKLITISGSECVEKIRSRLPPMLEKRMFALIRSANDSTSDVAIYKSRAHGFMPKAPIKKGGVLETLAPQWLYRFPPSEFPLDYSVKATTSSDLVGSFPQSDVACSPYDIAQKIEEINLLFQDQESDAFIYKVKEQIHGLKGDILTLNSSIQVTSIIGLLNLILLAQSQETISDKWIKLRDQVQDMIMSLGKNFRLPTNTYALAIDDSRIQRKLLSKFFDFAGIPQDHQIVLGERDEILSFEDTAVAFVENQKDNFVLLIVDENLDVNSEDSANHVTLSGSFCVEKIRNRLSKGAERKMLALVRSANDSSSDVSLYNIRAHGFLPKAPIRREKINETLAPLWYKRFPPTEFGLSLNPGVSAEAMPTISEDVACSPSDIATKLKEIESLFENGVHHSDPRKIHDVLHELKGDLLTMAGFSVSLIGILGQINLMLQSSPHDPDSITTKWQALCDRIQVALHSLQVPSESKAKPRNSKKFKRPMGLSKSASSKDPLSSSFLSISSDNSHTTIPSEGSAHS